jgi:flagellar biosynthesis/type III secretory pathway protein FliH
MKAYKLSEKDYAGLKVYMSGNIREGREQGFKEGYADGMQQGVQQGVQQGMQQGVQQDIQQAAINALKLGYTYQNVSALTGLTLEQVAELHKVSCHILTW